ncbi:MAG TPA: DNA polymerase/3'-5' exonuclease PolX [Candidatus Limnocylindrales bacterium]
MDEETAVDENTDDALSPAAAGDASGAEEDEPLTNGRLARIFHEIGDMLEVKGELVFKTVAYHRAADAIAHAPFDVASAYAIGDRPKLQGVGAAIADKIAELATTGRMPYYDRLRGEFPPTLVGLLEVPGVGPKTVKLVYEQLGVESVDDLRRAAEAGHLRTIKGLSERTERAVLDGIAALETRPRRLLIHRATALIDQLIESLARAPGVMLVQPAGSFRRRRETIGDLDLLVETSDRRGTIEAFTSLGAVDRVLNAGGHKAAVQLLRGPQVDLMLMPPGEAGTYLIHFTGSAAHNVRLRAMARDRGWSLSEKGYLRIGEDGEPLTGHAAELRTFPTEEEAYAFLDLPWIPPELREDRGEIEAALARRLPNLVTKADLRGDLHSHSEWSDGIHSIETMAEAARRMGREYQVLTDHTVSLAIAKGLDPERFRAQRAIVNALNERFAREEMTGGLPDGASPNGFRLLHGCELEIRADGRLDLSDDVLARFDLVVASLHVGRRQPRAQLTERVLTAINSPHVDVIAHPDGRMIQDRDDLDLEWEVVYAEAARTGTVLEMNGSPHRLDLSVERARRAIEVGCLVSIDSDAHATGELDDVRWGVDQARRAWVEAKDVLNARPRDQLLAWVAAKVERVAA